MHDRVSVNSLCFMGTPLSEHVKFWRELSPKRISFMSHQALEAGEDALCKIIADGGYRVGTFSHGFHMGPLPATKQVGVRRGRIFHA